MTLCWVLGSIYTELYSLDSSLGRHFFYFYVFASFKIYFLKLPNLWCIHVFFRGTVRIGHLSACILTGEERLTKLLWKCLFSERCIALNGSVDRTRVLSDEFLNRVSVYPLHTTIPIDTLTPLIHWREHEAHGGYGNHSYKFLGRWWFCVISLWNTRSCWFDRGP